MQKFATSIVLLPVLLFMFALQGSPEAIAMGGAPFAELKTMDEVDSITQNSRHRIFLSYDPVNCIHCYGYAKKLLTGLSDIDFVRDNDIKLGLINTRSLKGDQFDSGRDYASGFVYARSSNTWFFEEFTYLIEKSRPFQSYHSNLLNRTVKFLSQFVKPLKAVENFKMLDEELAQHGVIGIYLVSQNQTEFDRFKDFAIEHSFFPFFYNRDESQNYDILAHFGSSPKKQISDGFAIVRHPGNVTEFDKHRVSLMSEISSPFALRGFFTLNRLPKLMSRISRPRLLEAVHGSRLGLVIQIIDDSEQSLREQESFKVVVKKMPRVILFAQIQKTDPLLDEVILRPLKESGGVVFIMEIGKEQNAKIIGLTMEAEVTEENLYKFITRSLAMKILAKQISISDLFDSQTQTPVKEVKAAQPEDEALDDSQPAKTEDTAEQNSPLLDPEPDYLEKLGLKSTGWTGIAILSILITVFFN